MPARAVAPAAATLACLAWAAPGSSAKLEGTLTTWVDVSLDPIDGQCEFSKYPVNSTTDPILASYLRRGMHCQIGTQDPAFGNGALCGACYRIKSTSQTGTNGDKEVVGKISEAVVMVSTGGLNGTGRFDCFGPAFEAITGAQEAAEFPIEFEETQCTEIEGTPTVVNFGQRNEHYCKVVFENVAGWGTLSSVRGCLGTGESNCQEMTRLGGQAWTGCPGGKGDKITFTLRQTDPTDPSGEESSVRCICEGEWPWETGDGCTCGVNFGGISLSETSTTRTATTATTRRGEGNTGGGGAGNSDGNGDGDGKGNGDGNNDGDGNGGNGERENEVDSNGAAPGSERRLAFAGAAVALANLATL